MNNIASSQHVFSCRHSEIYYPVQKFKTELGSSFEFTLDDHSAMMIQADQHNSELEWLEHIIRINETRSVKKIFEGKLERRRGRGRPRIRWLDDVEDD